MAPLEHQTFLVTGASRGIGKALALRLAEEGATVVLMARASEALNETTQAVQTTSPNSYAVACDIGDLNAVAQAAESVLERSPALHGLVHNAGDIHPIKALMEANLEAWTRSMMVNLVGVQALTQHLKSALTGGHRVRVTTISSGAALRPLPSWSAYCTAKAGLDMWTRCLAAEGASDQLSAVSIAPGIVDTDMQVAIRSANEEDFPLRQNFVGYKEDGQLADPDEVAAKLFPLVTEQTMNDSGQRFDVRDL
jgi:benzil reductase ((S)-benzoin forming)